VIARAGIIVGSGRHYIEIVQSNVGKETKIYLHPSAVEGLRGSFNLEFGLGLPDLCSRLC
jgi:hypothetical protein